MNWASSNPSQRLKATIGGMVDSPTPMVPISDDSTSVMEGPLRLKTRARVAAAIQPAGPPPMIAMEVILSACMDESHSSWLRRKTTPATQRHLGARWPVRHPLHVYAQANREVAANHVRIVRNGVQQAGPAGPAAGQRAVGIPQVGHVQERFGRHVFGGEAIGQVDVGGGVARDLRYGVVVLERRRLPVHRREQ